MKKNPIDLSSDRVIYEDNHLIAVNKRPGELVQGDITGDIPLIGHLKDWIKTRDHKPGNVYIGSPHRLDRPVSGVVLFTKTSKALTRINALFKAHRLRKIYYAVVCERPIPTTGTLLHKLIRNHKQNKSYISNKGGKEAILNYKLIASGHRYHLLEIELKTGRHHQIRAQLAAIGCYIKGDLKYGAVRSNPGGGISLHARELSFIHPVKNEPLQLLADFPKIQPWPDLVSSITG